MSVDNTDDELILTRSPIDNSKPSSYPDTANLSSLRETTITVSTSALSTSSIFLTHLM